MVMHLGADEDWPNYRRHQNDPQELEKVAMDWIQQTLENVGSQKKIGMS
jgi:hypothetical protein